MGMSFSLKPDFEDSFARYEAFWHRTIVDRPPVCLTLPVDRPRPLPRREYETLEQRWLDVEFRAECIDIELGNRRHLADALPVAWPNMGPEIYSAWCGCGYGFGETTAWSVPCLADWADVGRFHFNPEHPLFKKTMEFTDLLLQRGAGRFIVGLTDFHPGGDHLAALRDPQRLCVDLIENPDEVRAELFRSQAEFFCAYDLFYEKLCAAGMPITSWINLPVRGRYYIPSNDFSCMIGPEMFEEFFLPGIAEECRFYERSIYHLDGPGALRHLDMLLSIPELDAVQWVPGAGNEGFRRWIPVYRRIQAARKSLYLAVHVSELESVFDSLRPEGVWFAGVSGADDEETAGRVLRRIEEWR